MFLRKLKTLACAVLVVGMTFGGAGALWRFAPAVQAAATGPVGDERAGGDRQPPGEKRPTSPPAADPFLDWEGPAGAPPRALATPAGEGARPLQTRIGLINLTRALKGTKKFRAAQADLRTRLRQVQEDLETLKKHVQQIQAECDDPATAAGRREELSQQIKRVNREAEDRREAAQRLMAKVEGDAVVAAYRELEEAARRLANARGLELVLFYNDAVTEADFYNPQNLQRKLAQPGALMPMVVAPGMDVTDAVIDALNRAYAPSGGASP